MRTIQYDGSIKIDSRIDNKGVTKGIDSIQSQFNKLSGTLKGFASIMGAAFSVKAIYDFSNASIKANSNLINAMIGVQSIVEGQGRSFEKAKQFLKDYVKDGLVPITEAATAYKNLSMRGYDDAQIKQVMISLKDSAAFGRQASLSMGQAIQSATEGLKNENSILVDNAGVTKNVSMMWKDYAEKLGVGVDSLTKAQKIQAEVNGIMEETRFQTGDAAKMVDTYSGRVAVLSYKWQDLLRTFGEGFMMIAAPVQNMLGNLIDGFKNCAIAFNSFISGLMGNDVKKTETATRKLQQTNNAISSIETSSNKAKKALKGVLASFDDINVLNQKESEDIVSVSTNTPQSSTPIVENVTSDTPQVNSKFIEYGEKVRKIFKDIHGIIKLFSPIIKGVGTALIAAFSIKLLSNALTGLIKFSKGFGFINDALTMGVYGYKKYGSAVTGVKMGMSQLKKSFVGFMRGLSPLTKAMIGVGGVVAVFTTTKSAIKDFVTGNKKINQVLLNTVPIIGGVGIALSAMLGPIGWVITAIGTLVGAVFGIADAQKEIQQQKIADYFNGVALKAENLNDILRPMTSQFSNMNDIISDHKEKMNSLNSEYENVSTSLDMIQTQTQKNSETIPENIGKLYDKLIELSGILKKAADEDTTYYYQTWDTIFLNTSVLSDERETEILNNIIQHGKDKKDKINSLENEITAIHDTAKSRNIGKTVEYTAEELAKLKGFQGELDALMNIEKNKEALKAKYEAAQLYEDIKDGRIKVTNEEYENILTTINEKEQEAIDIAKNHQNEALSNAEAKFNEMKTLYKDDYDKLAQLEKDYQDEVLAANDNFNKQLNEASDISGSTKKILLEKLKEEASAYNDTANKVKEYADILDELRPLEYNHTDAVTKNADIIKKKKERLKELDEELENNKNAVKYWSGEWGESAKGVKDVLNNMVSNVEQSMNDSISKFESYGCNTSQGLIDGINKQYSTLKTTAEEMFNKVEEGIYKRGEFGSPSKLMKKYGMWTTEGFVQGIECTKDNVIKSITTLFNAILSKEEEFITNFKIGINSMIDNIELTFGSYKSNNQLLSIQRMNNTSVPRLAKGAVISPNNEFLAVLGDQRNGVNIETPLSTMVDAFRIAMQDFKGSGNGNITLHVKSDDGFVRNLKFELDRESQRQGYKAVMV